MNVRLVAVAALCAGAGLAGAQSAAQSADPYPSRAVKVIVPYAPGGATDIIARITTARLNESLGQSFVVENRPGASGNIALEAAAKAVADGYTLFVGNVSTNAINENTFAHVLQIKPSRDFAGVTKLVEIPHIIAAGTSFPANTVAEAIALAKKDAGRFNFASAGLGSYPHLDMVQFAKLAGIEITHVPYKGGAGQMVPSLISGETQLAFINLASTLEHIRSGRLKALATAAGARLPELPGVATMAEQGFPGVGTNAWQGMFVPAATPRPIIDKLYAAVAAVLSRPEMKENLARQMMSVALSNSPQEFTEQVREETRKWGDVVRENRIRID